MQVKALVLLFCALVLSGVAVYFFVNRDGESDEDKDVKPVARVDDYMNLTSTDLKTVFDGLNRIEDDWHPGSAVMIIEALRFANFDAAISEANRVLTKKTGQSRGDKAQQWLEWIWNQEYRPHPKYVEFKSRLYSTLDERFVEYFEFADNATIRLDEVVWGGVKRDGIPPLKNPKLIGADEADYLADSNIVFGVYLNGEAKCYPKRILAHHEMFKDKIGGESVCGVY